MFKPELSHAACMRRSFRCRVTPSWLFWFFALFVSARPAVAKARIVVTSEPAGANLEWNGRFVGVTPFTTEVEDYAVTPPKYLWSKFLAEDITLRVWKDGYAPKLVRLTSGPFVWTNMAGTASKVYYVVGAREVHVVLERNVPTSQERDEPNAAAGAASTTSGPVTGTGFVLSQDGYVATNYHVVKDATRIELRVQGQVEPLVAIVAVKDVGNDLAILKTERLLPTGAPITFADPSSVKVGQDSFTLGYPLGSIMGSTVRLSTGTIDSLFGMDDDPRAFQISNPIQPGNSGGPLFNTNGQLVGVVFSGLDAKFFYEAAGIIPQNVNFALKASLLKNLVDTLPESGHITTHNVLAGLSREKQIEALTPSVVEITAHHEAPRRPTLRLTVEGLTPEEVRRQFGDPSSTDVTGLVVWFYDTPDGTLSVYFLDGKATLHRPTESASNSPKDAASTTGAPLKDTPSPTAISVESNTRVTVPWFPTQEKWFTSQSDTVAFLSATGDSLVLKLAAASPPSLDTASGNHTSRYGAALVTLHWFGEQESWAGLEESNPNCAGSSTWVLSRGQDVLLLRQRCDSDARNASVRAITLVLSKADIRPAAVPEPQNGPPPDRGDGCGPIAARIEAMHGDTLAAKIRAANPGSFVGISDDRLEGIFKHDFPCLDHRQ